MVGQLAYAYEKHSLILTFPTGPQSSRERSALVCALEGPHIFFCIYSYVSELIYHVSCGLK